MNFKKIFAVSAAAAICCSIAGCSGQTNSDNLSGDENSMEQTHNENGMYFCSDDNVKQIGRTYLDDENVLWMAFSGSGAEYSFTGKKCVVALKGDSTSENENDTDNHARIAVYVNGERKFDEMMDKPEKELTVIDSDTETTADIKIVKLSETAMSVCGIKAIEADGTISPAKEKSHRIEFIGDSITCGYGVDDEDRDHHFSTKTEDVTKAYAYKTAQKLDSDYSMVSISGYGIISGYSDNDIQQKSQIVPKYYDNLGFSYGTFGNGLRAADIAWDHSRFVPDAVVINLGTNDSSWCKKDVERCNKYKDGYIEFLKKVRAANPDAHIFCTLGVMGAELYPYVMKAAEEYSAETGDKNISCMKFASQLAKDGYAADWHPTEATHTKAAEKLTAEIKEVMGW